MRRVSGRSRYDHFCVPQNPPAHGLPIRAFDRASQIICYDLDDRLAVCRIEGGDGFGERPHVARRRAQAAITDPACEADQALTVGFDDEEYRPSVVGHHPRGLRDGDEDTTGTHQFR